MKLSLQRLLWAFFVMLLIIFEFVLTESDLSYIITVATEQSVEQTARAVGRITKRKWEYVAK